MTAACGEFLAGRCALDLVRCAGGAAVRHAGMRFRAGLRPSGRGHLGSQPLGDALGERGKLHLAQEPEQRLRILLVHAKALDRHLDIHVSLERNEIERQARLHGELDELLAPFRLLDLTGPLQQGLEDLRTR